MNIPLPGFSYFSPLVRVLSSYSTFEYSRGVGSLDPLRPPLFVWRLQRSDGAVEGKIKDALLAYGGPVQWEVEKGNRNSILQLVRFAEFARLVPANVKAQAAFAELKPEYTRLALEDLPRMVEHVCRALKIN